MEYLKLNNDVEMPIEGLGTFLMTPAEAEAAATAALAAGYEHIDTANAYMNERAVGRAIAKSGIARGKIFVSTKLWPSVYDAGMPAVDATLQRLGLDYVDMLILHQPVGDYLAAWRTMEGAYRAGKVRALGLSNFPQDKIAEVIEVADIKPQLVTVECHPYHAQRDLRAYLAPYGTVIEACIPARPRRQRSSGGARLRRSRREVRQDPGPGDPALARADGRLHHPRLQEPRPHRRQREHLRLLPHRRRDGRDCQARRDHDLLHRH